MATPRMPAAGSSTRRSAPTSDTGPTEMIGDFQRGKEIGKGSFATVYLAKHRVHKSYAAVKAVQMSKLTRKLKDNLESEVRILKSLQHPHIVALFLCEEKPMYIYLVMEYCKLSDLAQFMKKRGSLHQFPETADIFRKYPNPEHGGLNEVLARHFLKQIASALEYLRNRNFIHRDIKPQNLLLNPSPVSMSKQSAEELPLAASENSLTPAVGVPSLPMLKIADFGFARHLPSTSMAETLCGSPLYMAPEILRYEKYDARADLWSTGTVLHEMVVGKPPFRASNHVELLRRIEKANDQIVFDNKNITISRGMKDCIRKLLKKSPLDRVSYEDFFADPVVTGDIPNLVGEDRIDSSLKEPPVSELSRRMGKQAINAATTGPEVEAPRWQQRTSLDEVQERPVRKHSDQDARLRGEEAPLNRRRHSGTQNQAEPRDIPRTSTPRDQRRPSIIPHATAPGRQELHQIQPPSGTARMERRPSRASPLAGRPMVQEESNNEAENARQAERERRETMAFEKEYVVIEKRAVEVNAFADEMAVNAQPQAAMVRRATTQGQPTSVTGAQPAGTVHQTSNIRSQGFHQRLGSLEKRYAGHTLHNYISKVVNASAARVGFSPPWQTGQSPPPNYSAFPAYPTPQAPITAGEGNDSRRPVDEDTRIVRTMEDAAHRSDVIYGFAEVKFQQIFPSPPSARDGLGIQQIGSEQSGEEEEEDRHTTNIMLVGVCEEALVLYIKTLAVLAKTIDLAGYWWGKQQKRDTALAPEGSSPKSISAGAADIGNRMNNLVQWSRTRFNEVFEKCEIVSKKLLSNQKLLPEDHPGHPSNYTAGSGGTINTSTDAIQITSGVTAEKLMFERAVEMSRAAAVTELLGNDLPDCEISYQTSVMLLEGVLEGDDEPLLRRPSKMGGKADDEIVNGMETEDRATVLKLIEGNRHRLHTIRKKIAQQQMQVKRGSVSGSSGKGGVIGTPPR